MEIVDAQIHEPAAPRRLKESFGAEVERLLAVEMSREAMDSVGVDAALVFASYDHIKACVARYPDRFAGSPQIDHKDPDLEVKIATHRQIPGMLAFRNGPIDPYTLEPRSYFLEGKLEPVWEFAEKYEVPLFFSTHGLAHLLEPVAQQHPGLTMIIDHLGVSQSPVSPPRPDPWDQLPGLLGLAKYPNVYVKFCGAPVLSRESYPYKDVWPYLHRIFEAFGSARLMWGSDFTRLRRVPMLDPRTVAPRDQWTLYSDCLNFLRDTTEISESDKEQLFGKSIRQALRWEQLSPIQQWAD